MQTANKFCRNNGITYNPDDIGRLRQINIASGIPLQRNHFRVYLWTEAVLRSHYYLVTDSKVGFHDETKGGQNA